MLCAETARAVFSVQTFLSVLEYVGVLACAISGLRISTAKHFDMFGAYVVGLVTAIGGGSLRDAMLGVPMFWMRQPGYLVCTFFAVVVVWAFGRRIVNENIVLGVQKSFAIGHAWWIAVVMGMITGAAGGVMRDVLVNDVPLIFRSELYATASMLGALVYCGAHSLGFDLRICAVAGGAVVVATRILAVRYRWALPKLTGRSQVRRFSHRLREKPASPR